MEAQQCQAAVSAKVQLHVGGLLVWSMTPVMQKMGYCARKDPEGSTPSLAAFGAHFLPNIIHLLCELSRLTVNPLPLSSPAL